MIENWAKILMSVYFPVVTFLFISYAIWKSKHINRQRRQASDLENQQTYQQNNPGQSPEVYSEWTRLLGEVYRKQNCLTQYELDILFPIKKLKHTKIGAPLPNISSTGNVTSLANNTIPNSNGVKTSTNLQKKEKAVDDTNSLTNEQEKKIIQEPLTEKDITEVEIPPAALEILEEQVNKEDSNTFSKKQKKQKQSKANTNQYYPTPDTICSICHAIIGKENVDEDQDLTKVPINGKVKVRILSCNHYFHDKCISQWVLKRQANCPLCKKNLISEITIDILKKERRSQRRRA